jgi:chemotaxis protein methyltransferase CheR
MFRDPLVFLALRELVVPFLKTHPFCKFWVAGCATGEEVYSLAILLHEEGLLDRSQIYATDMNDESLKKARDAIYPLKEIKKYSENYLKAGGKRTLSEYYHSKYNNVIINSQLKKNITFANHNLVMDWVFGEMNLILCRNVLIYFAQELQNRVLRLFYESLGRSGYLCLGNKEDIRFLELARHFEKAHASEKIYKKIFVI